MLALVAVVPVEPAFTSIFGLPPFDEVWALEPPLVFVVPLLPAFDVAAGPAAEELLVAGLVLSLFRALGVGFAEAVELEDAAAFAVVAALAVLLAFGVCPASAVEPLAVSPAPGAAPAVIGACEDDCVGRFCGALCSGLGGGLGG